MIMCGRCVKKSIIEVAVFETTPFETSFLENVMSIEEIFVPDNVAILLCCCE